MMKLVSNLCRIIIETKDDSEHEASNRAKRSCLCMLSLAYVIACGYYHLCMQRRLKRVWEETGTRENWRICALNAVPRRS